MLMHLQVQIEMKLFEDTEDLSAPLSLTPTKPYCAASPHYFRKISVPHGPLLSSDWFCGRHWPSHRAQQHLQLCGMASRGRAPPSSSPRVPESSSVRTNPQYCLLSTVSSSVGLTWHSVVVAFDGEDNRG